MSGLSKDEQVNALLRDHHRRMQIQHGIISEDGTPIPRVRKKPPVQSKDSKEVFWRISK